MDNFLVRIKADQTQKSRATNRVKKKKKIADRYIILINWIYTKLWFTMKFEDQSYSIKQSKFLSYMIKSAHKLDSQISIIPLIQQCTR